ncbi:hypothetical protein L596_014931 [Steinernema carpocapsae]|uniref:Elongation of very long chain fatty acids protein n=1 Tax=Steinernema carpocapsae TaxID=34508 RepID=A0A4U5NEN7_STECR|nr:hypothetical protein L596_014931 [Steinernema carpocapsae]
MDLPYEELKAKLGQFHFDPVGFWNIVAAKEFPEAAAKSWIRDHQPLAIQVSIAYVLLVFGTKWFMKNREPFNLSLPLSIWNFFLAAFSIAGTLIMGSEFFGTIKEKGVMHSYLIIDDFTKGRNGLWVFLFIASKLIELVDTAFVVLRKRPLMFLHWYHHALTVLNAYYCYPHSPAFSRWGIYLNFGVHAFMYSYYFLRSLKFKLPGILAKIITSLQILQFVISCAILTHVGFLVYGKGLKCDFESHVFTFAAFMDTTYLILFINFFLRSYILSGGKAKYSKPKSH